MRALLSRFLGDRRGVIALKFALALPVLSLLAAGAIDLSHVSSSKSRLQDIADSAALAGATELGLAISNTSAIERATAYVDGHLEEWRDAPRVVPTIAVTETDHQRILHVTLAGNRPSFFGNLLPPGGWNFTARSSATAVGMMPLCVLVTGDKGKELLNVNDTGVMNAPACLVHSNRDIRVKGGSITAAQIQAVTTAGGVMSPVAGTGAARIEDPFAALPMTQDRKLECALSGVLEPVLLTVGSKRLPSGVHCGGIEVRGDARLTLEPGPHWFLGGHLIMRDNTVLDGTEGVTLFFDKRSKFEFRDESKVDLTAQKTGVYAGIVMAGTRDNNEDFVISSDNVESLLGVIYVPNARLIIEGKSDIAKQSAWTVIVAKELQLKGSPSLFVNANYSASDVPVPTGVGPRTGGAHLVD